MLLSNSTKKLLSFLFFLNFGLLYKNNKNLPLFEVFISQKPGVIHCQITKYSHSQSDMRLKIGIQTICSSLKATARLILRSAYHGFLFIIFLTCHEESDNSRNNTFIL